MALKIERRGTTSDNISSKPLVCNTCKQRKPGLYFVDVYGYPMCHDCAVAANRVSRYG